MSDYYNSIAEGYDALHGEEQLRKLTAIAQNVQPQGRLLDVGCGTGISTDFFSDQCDCTGIDPSAGLIGQNKNEKASFVIGQAEAMPFDDAEFDVVISLTAIQNFDDISKGLEEMKRVGKNTFVLTWLKKSAKSSAIDTAVRSLFGEPSIIIDDLHDHILIYRK